VLLTPFVADKRGFKYQQDEKLLEATHALSSLATQSTASQHSLRTELSELERLNSETIQFPHQQRPLLQPIRVAILGSHVN